MFKNNAESSLFELLRDVFSKSFSKQHPLCLISHVHFLSPMRYHRFYHSVVWNAPSIRISGAGQEQVLRRRFFAYKTLLLSAFAIDY
jgi:hypothetical protein